MSAEDRFLEPPEPHECDDPDCDGALCEQRSVQSAEDAMLDRADSIRKGEWYP